MSGLPIKNLPSAIIALQSLARLEQKFLEWANKELIDYRYTWDNYSISVTRTSQKIVDITVPGNYQIFITNPEKADVSLYLGSDGDEMLSLDNSGWKLSINGDKIKSQECTIWAISANNSPLQITIHSDRPNSNKSGKMPNPLIVFPFMQTGDNFYSSENFLSPESQIYITNLLDSKIGITGFRGLALKSYDPTISKETGYRFTVTFDESFSTVVYPGEGKFIEVHEIKTTFVDEIQSFLWAEMLRLSERWSDSLKLPRYPLNKFKTWVSEGKRVEGLQKFKNISTLRNKLDDTIVLHPSFITKYYFFKVRLDTGDWKFAVIDYDEINQNINILGF